MSSTQLSKTVWVLVVALAVSGSALGQYGGGGGGTGGTGTGTYTNRSYGNGAKIGAALGGAAAAGVLFYALHHRHAQVVGCVSPNGTSLTTDKGKKTYQLAGAPVTAGDRLTVIGKKRKGSGGVDELEVLSVKKNMGQCERSTAMTTSP